MKKQKLIIINGCKGSGKSTITNWLREQMVNTNLFRNSGHGKITRKDICQEDATFYYFDSLLDVMIASRGCGYNFIWDSSFITEQVYCDLALGSKDYDFTNYSQSLMMKLNNRVSEYYDICMIQLVCDHKTISNRLNGRQKGVYDNISFTSANSMREQARYLELHNGYRDKYHNISFYELNSTDENQWKHYMGFYNDEEKSGLQQIINDATHKHNTKTGGDNHE